MTSAAPVIETFSTLEPIAGVLLALVLAYLALPNLRYREQMNRMAKRALVRLEIHKPTEECCGVHYSRLVKYAGGLAEKLHTKRRDNHDHAIPESEDSNKYDWLFPVVRGTGWQLDTKIAGVIGALALTVLNLGVIENSDIFGLSEILKSIHPTALGAILVVINVAFFVPLVLILVGRRWVDWARQQIEYLERECEKEILAKKFTGLIPDEAPSFLSAEQITVLRDQMFKVFPELKTALPQEGEKGK